MTRPTVRRSCAVLVIASCLALAAANFLWVVTGFPICATFGGQGFCSSSASYQTWWGISTSSATWDSGATNWWAALFPLAAISGIVWGLAALRFRQQRVLPMVVAGALTAGLLVVALAANLVQLARFELYWRGRYLLTTNTSLPMTIASSVVALVALVVVAGTLDSTSRPQVEPFDSRGLYSDGLHSESV